MNDSSEFIGSMPSTPQPQPEPKPQAPVQAGPTVRNTIRGSVYVLVGSLCCLVFPVYAQTDDLGSGIFYGAGFFLLFIAVVGICQTLATRGRKDRPAPTHSASSAPLAANPGRSGRLRWINGLLAGMVFVLLGIFLMIAPDILPINDGGLVSVFLCIVGLSIIFLTIIRYINYKLISPGAGGNQPETRSAAEIQASNQARGSITLLIIVGAFLGIGRAINVVNPFWRGFGYGIGLILLLITALTLTSTLFSFTLKKRTSRHLIQ